MILYIGKSSSDAAGKDRAEVRSTDCARGCTTIQIRNAAGITARMESAIMLGIVNVAAKANVPSRNGMTLVSEFKVAAENFGHVRLSCSAARAPAAVSTRSMLSSRAAARRWAAIESDVGACRPENFRFRTWREEPGPSPQISLELATAVPRTPSSIRHPSHTHTLSATLSVIQLLSDHPNRGSGSCGDGPVQ